MPARSEGGRTGPSAPGPAIIFVGEAVAAGDWGEAADLAQASFKVA